MIPPQKRRRRMDFVHQRLAGIVEQVHKWPHWVWLLPVHIVLLAPATGYGLSLWNDRCLQQNTTAPLFMSPSQALVVAAVDGSVIFPLIVARSLTVYQRVMRVSNHSSKIYLKKFFYFSNSIG